MAGPKASDPYGSFGSVPTSSPLDGGGGTPMSVRATPNDFGAQIGDAEQNLGKTGEKASSELNEVVQHHAEMAVHTATNDQIVNGYVPAVNDLTSRYKQLQGTEAVRQLPEYQKQLQDINKQYLSVGGPLQQQYMGEFVSRHAVWTMNDMSNHADQQFTKHQDIVNTQSIKASSDEAANNWQDPNIVDYNVKRAEGLSQLHYTNKLGYDPESQVVAQQMSKEEASKVAASAIDMAIDNHDYEKATMYKNKYSDVLSGHDKLRIEKSISAERITVDSSQYVDNLLGGLPAVTPGTATHAAVQSKADIAQLAQKENFDPNIAFALHGTESDYGHSIKDSSRLKDDFQTDPRYRDPAFADDSLSSSMHNAAKIWNENSTVLTKAVGRPLTPSEGYLAYNQGGAGAAALLNANSADTAVDALSKIMPVADAQKHVMQNGGTATMSAGDFSKHLQDMFQNHYDSQKTTVAEGTVLPSAIRDQANVQLPATQQVSNPHEYFKQVEDRIPAAQAAIDALPDDKIRDSAQKQLNRKYQQAKLGETIWKNKQADVALQFGQDPRYTSMAEVPQTVKSNLQQAGQLKALESMLNDKNNPKKDNTYGDAFVHTLERVASDDKTDAISDNAGLQQAYGDTPGLHSSGFKQLQSLVKMASTPDGKAQIGQQSQFLSDLRQKMVAGESDAQGKKDFEAALPKFFSAYSAAQTKGNTSDVLSFDPNNKNSFVASLKVPSSAEMTSKKIQNSTSWLSSFFSGSATPTFTPQEQIMADYSDGKITAAQKNAKLKGLTPATNNIPRPE